MTEATNIISRIEAGDLQAADQLLPLVYGELRRLADAKLSQEKPGQTLQATALVHEAYVRLIGSEGESSWKGRGHFFGAAAEAMRRILVDRARSKKSIKGGGNLQRQPLGEPAMQGVHVSDDVLDVHEALKELEQVDREGAQLVKLRYFAGLTIPQAAEALDISTSTADRYWAYARSWLHTRLRPDEG